MWLLPSRRRPEKLARFFDACRKTNTSTPGIVLVDFSDYADNKTAYDNLDIIPRWKLLVTEGESCGDKNREVLPILINEEWVGLLGDDNIPEMPEWDTKLVSELKGWNVVSSNDGWQAPKRMHGAIAISGPLLRAIGYIYPGKLQHIFVDDVWEILGRESRCWQVCMDIMVRHDHVFTGVKPDDTHRKGYGFWYSDEPIFREWLANEKDNCLDRIADLGRKYSVDLEREKVFFLKPKPRYHGGIKITI